MNKKVQNPNQKSHGFAIALVALIVIIAVVVTYIVMTGKDSDLKKYADREKVETSFNVAVDGDAIVLKSDKVQEKPVTIDLYEDYSCHVCRDLEAASGDRLKQEIDSGAIILKIHSLNFLDQKPGEGHSSLAGTAALTVAKAGEANAYWNYRALLMDEQPNILGAWTPEDFGTVAAQVGASEDVVKEIQADSAHDEFLKIAKENSDYLEKKTGQVSSPRVFIDGKERQLTQSDLENGTEWIDQALAENK